MRVLDAETIRTLAPMERLVPCLEDAFRKDWAVPARQVIPVGEPGGRVFLVMPAFDAAGAGAVKLVSFFPDNPSRSLPTIQGVLVVFSDTGSPIAVLDGSMVTRLRTGAASALASTFLSRTDSAHLVLLGTGALAPYMGLAHCAVRPIRRVSVWGRHRERAEATVAELRARIPAGVSVESVDDLERSVATADVVCCATRSSKPILEGRWLRPGTFVDLVGSFSPADREADDEVIRRARVFVDTREGALTEAGDLLSPLRRGVIGPEKIEGDLKDLVRGRVAGRVGADEVTLFKSVGTAIEDLATAQMIVASALKPPDGDGAANAPSFL